MGRKRRSWTADMNAAWCGRIDASAGGLFRPVVAAFVLALLDAGHAFLLGCLVVPELVGDHHITRST